MTKSKFQLLSDREHLLLRPSMYIGSVSSDEMQLTFNGETKTYHVNQGLLKIIDEILDNSIDECLRTSFKTNKIDITTTFTPALSITIKDNGNGIPTTKHLDLHGNEKSQIELAFCHAKSGSNFSNDDRVTVGMNGIGSFATNVFSKSFKVESRTKEMIGILECSDNANVIKYKEKPNKTSSTGVSVSFIPDLNQFEIVNLDDTYNLINLHIYDRMSNILILYPSIKFTLNKTKIVKPSKYSISQTVKTSNNTYAQIAVYPNKMNSVYSIVNGVKQYDGTHINYIYKELHTLLEPKLKRKFKHNITLNQIKSTIGLSVWFSMFANPMFDSQNKTKITNTVAEIKEYVNKHFDLGKIANAVLKDDELMDYIKETLFSKLDMDEQKELQKLKKPNIIKSAKHIPASRLGNDDYETALYITEGLSAISNLLPTRNPDIHGGYSLRGKVMNVYDCKMTEILKNTELNELMNIIGLLQHNPFEYYRVTDGETVVIAKKGDTVTIDGESITV